MIQYNTRVQLKRDKEIKWQNIENTFKPLDGEMIIYSPDDTHEYSRLKIGDGTNYLANLEFIDAGTVQGHHVEIVKITDNNSFPVNGSVDKLYINLANKHLYYYDIEQGYIELMAPQYASVSSISSYDVGRMTEITLNNNILNIRNGRSPSLHWTDFQAVQNI